MATNAKRGRPRKDVTSDVSLAAWITEPEMVLLDNLLAENDPYMTRSSVVKKWLHQYFISHGYDPRTLQPRSRNDGKGGSGGLPSA